MAEEVSFDVACIIKCLKKSFGNKSPVLLGHLIAEHPRMGQETGSLCAVHCLAFFFFLRNAVYCVIS